MYIIGIGGFVIQAIIAFIVILLGSGIIYWGKVKTWFQKHGKSRGAVSKTPPEE